MEPIVEHVASMITLRIFHGKSRDYLKANVKILSTRRIDHFSYEIIYEVESLSKRSK